MFRADPTMKITASISATARVSIFFIFLLMLMIPFRVAITPKQGH